MFVSLAPRNFCTPLLLPSPSHPPSGTMSSSSRPQFLASDGDGGLHLPKPYPTFVIKKQTMSRFSPFLADLYSISNHVFISKTDDPEAVCVLAKMFHSIEISLPLDDITLERILGIANLFLKWKCTADVISDQSILWIDKLKQLDKGFYEPWKTWISIASAFGRLEIIDAVLEKHKDKIWRTTGYTELEELRNLADSSVVGKSPLRLYLVQ